MKKHFSPSVISDIIIPTRIREQYGDFFMTLENLLNSFDTNEDFYKKFNDGRIFYINSDDFRKNFKEMLQCMHIYKIFHCLYKKNNDWDFDENIRLFIYDLLKSFSTDFGKTLRKQNYEKICNKFKPQLIDLLNKFDKCLENKPKSFQIWFHNTPYYFIIFEPNISLFFKNLNSRMHETEIHNQLYYLSNTQRNEFCIDFANNIEGFIKEGEFFIAELNELAYTYLNRCADSFYEIYPEFEEIYNILQVLTQDMYDFEENQKNKKNNRKKKHEFFKKIDIFNDKLVEKLKNPEITKIYNKYIRKGKFQDFIMSNEDEFVAQFGIKSYRELKSEIINNSTFSYKYIQ